MSSPKIVECKIVRKNDVEVLHIIARQGRKQYVADIDEKAANVCQKPGPPILTYAAFCRIVQHCASNVQAAKNIVFPSTVPNCMTWAIFFAHRDTIFISLQEDTEFVYPPAEHIAELENKVQELTAQLANVPRAPCKYHELAATFDYPAWNSRAELEKLPVYKYIRAGCRASAICDTFVPMTKSHRQCRIKIWARPGANYFDSSQKFDGSIHPLMHIVNIADFGRILHVG